MHVRRFGAAILVVLTTWSAGLGATATFRVVAKDAPDATSVTITTGGNFEYEIRLKVTPADEDTDGLAGFAADLLTDTGVNQVAAATFGTEVATSLTAFATLGTPNGDDITGISASQLVLGSSGVKDIALNTEIVLVTGVLTMPATEGTYHVTLGAATTANVLNPGDTGGTFKPTIELEDGLTVITSADDGSTDGDTITIEDIISAFLVFFAPMVFIVTIVAILFLLMRS